MCVYGACLFYVCCSDCVGVCGNVCCVAAVVKNSVFFSLGVLKYVVCLCRGCDGCCVFCLSDACSSIIHALICCRLDCNSFLYNVSKNKADQRHQYQ